MRMKKQKEKQENAENLKKKAIKRIFTVIMAGLVIMAVDFLAASITGAEIVRQGANMYMVRPSEGEDNAHISFDVMITGEKEKLKKSIDVSLKAQGKENEGGDDKKEDNKVMAESERLEYEIRKISDGFNDEISEKMVKLPQKLDTGEKITWSVRRETNSIAIAAGMIIMIIMICRTYMKPLEKRRQEERESVIRNLPEFTNKLVLLLNAGMVLTSAFETAISESIRFKQSNEDYFFRRMKEMYIAMTVTNSSLNEELKKFAKENGTKELMRISNIINDNISKGAELTEKLRNESEILWTDRKKSGEERGRLAETKLTLPLMIFLIVLIVITVAPALMEL